MNKYKVIQVICWLIVFVVFVGLAIWFLVGNRSRFHVSIGTESLSGPYEEVGRYRIEAAGVDSLDIEWTAGAVKLIPYEEDEILLVEYAQRDLEEDEKLKTSTNKGSLSVSFCEKNRWMKSMPPKRLELFLPKELAAGLKDFRLDCVSADVDIQDLRADHLKIQTVSGDQSVKDISADSGKISSTSGSIELSNLRINRLTLSTVSGEIKSDRLEAEEISADTTSGNVKFSDAISGQLEFDTVTGDVSFLGSFENLNADTTSGSMNITTQLAPNTFRISSVSGDVHLTMPSFEGFNLQHETVSGSFTCEIPVTTIKESNPSYKIETTSGDIDIRKLN